MSCESAVADEAIQRGRTKRGLNREAQRADWGERKIFLKSEPLRSMTSVHAR